MKNNKKSIVRNEILQKFYERIKVKLRGIINSHDLSDCLYLRLHGTNLPVLIELKGIGSRLVLDTKLFILNNSVQIIESGNIKIKEVKITTLNSNNYLQVQLSDSILAEVVSVHDLSGADLRNYVDLVSVKDFDISSWRKLDVTTVTSLPILYIGKDGEVKEYNGTPISMIYRSEEAAHSESSDLLTNGLNVKITAGLNEFSGKYVGGTVAINENSILDDPATHLGVTYDQSGRAIRINDNFSVPTKNIDLFAENQPGLIKGASDDKNKENSTTLYVQAKNGYGFVTLPRQIPTISESTSGVIQTDSLDNLNEDGIIVQYVGETNKDYTKGYFYQCQAVENQVIVKNSQSELDFDKELFKKWFNEIYGKSNTKLYSFEFTGELKESEDGDLLKTKFYLYISNKDADYTYTIDDEYLEYKQDLYSKKTFAYLCGYRFAEADPGTYELSYLEMHPSIFVRYPDTLYVWEQINIQPQTEYYLCTSANDTPTSTYYEEEPGLLTPSEAHSTHSNYIYLIKRESISDDDYEEWVVVQNNSEYQWEKLGSIEQLKISAGNNIDITNNTISAIGYKYDTTNQSFAEGSGSIASGVRSHAEGYDTNALGNQSHAEGYGTQATNNGAHAEGDETVASGKYSHAEGESTQARGDYSHAGGEGTIASGRAQFVCGRYNTPNEDDLFIIGNGDGISKSNALTVSKGGVLTCNSVVADSVSNDGVSISIGNDPDVKNRKIIELTITQSSGFAQEGSQPEKITTTLVLDSIKLQKLNQILDNYTLQ